YKVTGVQTCALPICINLSIIGVVSWREFAPLKSDETPKAVVSMMMERVWGGNVATALSWMVIWTAFGSIFCLLLGYSRIPYAARSEERRVGKEYRSR